ncbi:MAG: radical SAM protein [Planctomycetota bacterium]
MSDTATVASPPSEGVKISRSGARSNSPVRLAMAAAEKALKPVTVAVELTYRCNIDCLHCYCVRGGDQRELTTEEWKGFLDHTAKEGGLFLTLSGGEILVRRDFFEIYNHTRDLGYAVKLKTNATLINEEIADRIAQRHPMVVDVSILGGSSTVHDRITRSRGSHDKAWRGIELLRERGVNVSVRTSIMGDNHDEYHEIRAKARGLGCGTNCDANIFPKNDADPTTQDHRLEAADFKKFLNTLTLAQPLGRKKPRNPDELLMCGAGRGHFSVNPYGDITTCNPLQIPLGNARTDSWADVRRSKLLQRIVSMTIHDLPECRACEYREYCDRCHAMAFLETGSIVQKSVQACKMAKLVKAMADDHEAETREVTHV